MASRKENLSGLFRNSRTRTIIILTGFLVSLMVLIGYFSFSSRIAGGGTGSTQIQSRVVGGIESIPGSVNPTKQYVELLEKQNEDTAARAKRSGQSAIPTLVRSELFGPGSAPKDVQGATGVGFSTLVRSEAIGADLLELWKDKLRDRKCSAEVIQEIKKQGAPLSVFKDAGCSVQSLLAAGYNIAELKAAGFSAEQLKAAGFTATQLRAAGYTIKELRAAGFSACEMKNAGYSAKELADAGYGDGELKGAGFTDQEIANARPAVLPFGYTPDSIKRAGCSPSVLRKAKADGVSESDIKRFAGCTESQLRAAGFLGQAASVPPGTLSGGYTEDAIRRAGCGVDALKKARAAGVSAEDIKRISGCSAAQLRAAGYTAKELKDAGFSAQDLKNAGFSGSDLKDAGYSPAELKNAGFNLKDLGYTAKELKDAGMSAKDLLNAGFSPGDLKDAGFSAASLKDAGVSDQQLRQAGFSDNQLRDIGVIPTSITGAEQPSELQQVLARQLAQQNLQRVRQLIQQQQTAVGAESRRLIGTWKSPTQVYVSGAPEKDDKGEPGKGGSGSGSQPSVPLTGGVNNGPASIRTGDVLFAVIDTAVNSDEEGPILATIVTGPYKGARVIGSLRLPPNASKALLTFNTMTLRNQPRSISISAVAVDEDTARTGISSRTDKHYIERYGSLFMSSFLQGFGQAVTQSGTATFSTPGATATVNFGRKNAQNLLASLGRVGQAWGQATAGNFNRPYTVNIYSGTPVGLLFTSDVVLR